MTALANDVVALGVRIDRIDLDTALARFDELLRRPGCARVAFVNAHSVNLSCSDDDYRAALRRADLVLNDGAGVALLGKAVGAPFLANLNGTDLLPRVLHRLGEQHTVFLYGGRPGVAERAALALRRDHPHLRVVGHLDGYGRSDAEVVDAVRRSGARVLLVALGNPRQELWIDRHGDATGVAVAVSVGAFLDFAAGQVPRAPTVLRTLRLEWVFRLLREPRRLARRYVIGVPVFLARIAGLWWTGVAAERAAPDASRRPVVTTYEYPPFSAAGVW